MDALSHRALDEIARLAHAGLRLPALFEEAARVLRKVVPYEAACWHTLDPGTLLETSHQVENLPFENPLASELEYLHEDFNQFAALARARRRSGILSVATGGRPERSLRYRELIRPFGLQAEMRAAFVTEGAGWGAVGLLRPPGAPDFTRDEADLLHEVSGYLAHAVRSSVLHRAAEAHDGASDGPGLVLLDHRFRLESVTPAAERVLAELEEGGPPATRSGELPYVVYAIAARARSAAMAPDRDALAYARVRTRAGRWLAMHGALADGHSERIAVIVQSAQPGAVAPLIVEAYGLTARERELVDHLLRGASTKEIAAALRISSYTVQEHFKRIFDKLGVRSRIELVGKVFG